ncbi:hypothetical protein JCM15519_27330 [Fundidesulfovibrio butyratiphilus]
MADTVLLGGGLLLREHLVTLRRGEPAYDNVADRLVGLAVEIIKIGGENGAQACRFHRPERQECSIHEKRPIECRALDCRDTRAIEALYDKDRLCRAALVNTQSALWEIVAFHERTFSAIHAVSLARRIVAGDRAAEHELADLARREADFRMAFAERFDNPPGEMDFLFGRSLAQVLAPYALSALADL